MEFTTDADGKELLLKDGEHQVMMEWERPYMKACIELLEPSGDVLEIGFGLGYSADAIQSYQPKSHTIIEYHPIVAEKAKNWAKDKPNVTIIESTWQEALPKLDRFDAIFFDDYPLESASDIKTCEEAQAQAKQNSNEVSAIQKEMEQYRPSSYSNHDLEFLFENMKTSKHLPSTFYHKFFTDLLKNNEITPEQFKWVQEKLAEKNVVLEEPLQPRGPGDRLLQFLEPVLKNHLNTRGRFSCYIERTESLYQDKAFKKLVINDPFLDFIERITPVNVSPHCKYFKGDKAFMIRITKLS